MTCDVLEFDGKQREQKLLSDLDKLQMMRDMLIIVHCKANEMNMKFQAYLVDMAILELTTQIDTQEKCL